MPPKVNFCRFRYSVIATRGRQCIQNVCKSMWRLENVSATYLRNKKFGFPFMKKSFVKRKY